jgi:exopolyphosphatase/guanosine-5'-triphosphate,3'-diphosphate pyrophosphatase
VIKYKNSFHTGVVSCTERFLKDDPPTLEQLQEFEQHLDNVFRKLSSLNYAPAIAIALAGTSTTLACMNLNIKNYDEELIEGHILKFNEIYNIKDDIRRLSSSELLKSYNLVVKGREDLILAGSIILLKIMDLLKIDKVRVSTKGIRYGAILKEIKVNN